MKGRGSIWLVTTIEVEGAIYLLAKYDEKKKRKKGERRRGERGKKERRRRKRKGGMCEKRRTTNKGKTKREKETTNLNILDAWKVGKSKKIMFDHNQGLELQKSEYIVNRFLI